MAETADDPLLVAAGIQRGKAHSEGSRRCGHLTAAVAVLGSQLGSRIPTGSHRCPGRIKWQLN